MLYLLRLISLLTLVLIAGLVAIIGLTYRNTNRFAYLFTRPDGTRCETPCLFGADPARMTLGQIDKILSLTPALKQAQREQLDGGWFTYQNGELMVSASQTEYEKRGGVGFASDFPTLGELLLLLGKPERVHVDFTYSQYVCNSLTFFIRGQMVVLSPKSEINCMNSSQEITTFAIFSPDPHGVKGSVVWQGFNTDTAFQAMLMQLGRSP